MRTRSQRRKMLDERRQRNNSSVSQSLDVIDNQPSQPKGETAPKPKRKRKTSAKKSKRQKIKQEPGIVDEVNSSSASNNEQSVDKPTVVSKKSKKPFTCCECGKCFTSKYHLKVHKRVHSGIRPWKCGECGKSFTRKGDLKKHKQTT